MIKRFAIRTVLLLLAVGVLAAGYFSLTTTQAQIKAPTEKETHYYLGQWEWHCDEPDFCYWRCPHDCVGLIDLRALPQMGRAGGTPEGYGFFVYDQPQLDLSLFYLGDSLEHNLMIAQKQGVETRLHLVEGITQNTLLDVLWTDILINNGDPTGQERWKPLRGSPRTGIRLSLAGKTVRQEAFGIWHPAWPGTLAVFQEDYKRLRERCLEVDSTHYKKVLDAASKKYRMSPEALLEGSGVLFEGTEPSETVIGDTFVEDDGNVNLDAHVPTGPNAWDNSPSASWANVVADAVVVAADDQVACASGTAASRAEYDLSSDDMYCETDILNAQVAASTGPKCRFDAAAETYYTLLFRNSTTLTHRLFKFVTGTPTQIGGTVTEDPYPSTPFNYRLDVSGSDLEGFLDDVSKIAETDSSLTGQLRAGIGVPAGGRQDNFEAGDLGEEAPTTNAYWMSIPWWLLLNPLLAALYLAQQQESKRTHTPTPFQ